MILEEDMLEVGATIANNPPKKASKDNRKIPKVIHHHWWLLLNHFLSDILCKFLCHFTCIFLTKLMFGQLVLYCRSIVSQSSERVGNCMIL